MNEYRIEYSIQRQTDHDDDFVEIGFGSSGTWDDVDSALHAAETEIQRGNWEITGDMPEQEGVDHE